MDKGIKKRVITQPNDRRLAHGGPGVTAHWTSGAKTLVGTATSARSRIWFTVNNGAIAEIYHPDVDQANTRVVRFLVTGEDGFFSDEIWDADHRVAWLEPGVPGCRIETQCKRGRYTLSKEIITDPLRDVLLLRVRFTPKDGEPLRLFLSLDPHVGDEGENNHAWAGQYKGEPMLFACRGELALAVAAAPALQRMSVGYIGDSDAYTLLSQGKSLPTANVAESGNVALTAEIDYRRQDSAANEGAGFTISLACGADAAEAGQQARAGLLQDFAKTRDLFVRDWREEQARYLDLQDLGEGPVDVYRASTAVLESHQSKRFPGGFVASLSLPWGFAHTDKDVGGYHVVWPRDLAESAMGKLAAGDARSARAALFYLACTQSDDGGWSQNMWLDGTPHWTAIQMDSVALPVLLADKLRRDDALDGYDPRPMMHEAVRFVLKHGPVTEQDRWETTPGYSPYTMAVQVAALLAGADCADQRGAPGEAEFLRETADAWNDAIDELTYVEGTALAKAHGVPGYYLRMSPPRRIETRTLGNLKILMPNHRWPKNRQKAAELVSPDALALVRFGLRAAEDPRIVNTVRVIDATLRHETRTGPAWQRATDDGYGETREGRPFDGSTGIGRGWPLLAGERGHLELAAGRREEALHLLQTMSRQTSECGMLPEQVWDADDLPGRELFNGKPTGSGMPLAWAHAEYIKLLRSLHEGAVWDAVPQTQQRYITERRTAGFQIWRPKQRRAFVSTGKDLRVDLDEPACVRWRIGGKEQTARTTDSGLGLHTVRLPLASVSKGTAVRVFVEPEDAASKQGKDAFLVKIRD